MATDTIKSAIYVWEGMDRRGQKSRGEITSASLILAKAQLRKQGIAPTVVKKKPKALFTARKKPIKPMDIALFTRQMATMTKAGVPLVQSFDIVAEGLENPALRDLILAIKNEVASGTAFASALAKHPRYFDNLFCSLVQAGEQSGALEIMLDRVATYKEKTEQLKTKIRKAMTYPIAVISVAIVVTGILLIYVVPEFAKTFQGFGSDLPAFTQMVVALSEWVQAYWWMIIAGGIATFYAFKEGRLRSKKFADFVDRATLKLPIVGNILYQAIIARFARTLATTFAAGVPLVEALTSVAGAAGNVVYENAIIQVRDDVTTGQQLNTAIKTTGRFPIMVVQMVSIGEESGALDEMLDKCAEHYELEVDAAVDNLTTLLEPMIMAVLGVLVGGLMIAMYLPIFMLGEAIAG
ncbi:MAG: type II secretion system F family protein [Pseudomonadales bacterium]